MTAVSYTYDKGSGYPVGHLTGIAAAGISSMTYSQFDALGRAGQSTEAILGNSYTFRYTYNRLGSLTSETYPSGRIVNMTYDPANRITQLAGSKAYVNAIAYAPHGGFQSFAYGNGLMRSYAYDSSLQPAQMVDVPASRGCTSASLGPAGKSTWAMNLQFFWEDSAGQIVNNNGNLKSQLIQTCNGAGYVTANNYSETYGYDGVNRVVSFTDNGNGNNQRNFAYDLYGNKWAANIAGSLPLNASMPGSNIYSNNKRTDALYDLAGNQANVSKVCTAANCLQYDAENRQTAYTGSGATYSYDGNGNRVLKLIAGVYTVYVYDGFGSLAAQYSSGTAAAAACTTWYLSWDHLGSTRMVTDQAGKLVARHDYLPFGEEITNGYAGRPATGTWGGADTAAQKFTGKERDVESGLDYFGARYYGSALGRFTTSDWSSRPDPVPYVDLRDPQTLNLYTYGRNNPLSNRDEDGHCTVDGETHGWLWCATNVLGFTESQREQQVQADEQRQKIAARNVSLANGQKLDQKYLAMLSSAQVGILAAQLANQEMDEHDPLSEVLNAATPFLTSWGWNNSPSYIKARNELTSRVTIPTCMERFLAEQRLIE